MGRFKVQYHYLKPVKAHGVQLQSVGSTGEPFRHTPRLPSVSAVIHITVVGRIEAMLKRRTPFPNMVTVVEITELESKERKERGFKLLRNGPFIGIAICSGREKYIPAEGSDRAYRRAMLVLRDELAVAQEVPTWEVLLKEGLIPADEPKSKEEVQRLRLERKYARKKAKMAKVYKTISPFLGQFTLLDMMRYQVVARHTSGMEIKWPLDSEADEFADALLSRMGLLRGKDNVDSEAKEFADKGMESIGRDIIEGQTWPLREMKPFLREMNDEEWEKRGFGKDDVKPTEWPEGSKR